MVLPTRLTLAEFYEELVATQRVLARKQLGAKQIWGAAKNVAKLLAHGQTSFVRMLFKFSSVYDPKLQLADHAQPIVYEIPLPPEAQGRVDPSALYVHPARGRHGREIDEATEGFVDRSRMAAASH